MSVTDPKMSGRHTPHPRAGAGLRDRARIKQDQRMLTELKQVSVRARMRPSGQDLELN